MKRKETKMAKIEFPTLIASRRIGMFLFNKDGDLERAAKIDSPSLKPKFPIGSLKVTYA